MDLHELVRRFQAGETRNAISRAMDLSVNTVTAYRRWAEAQNLLTGTLPDLATLERLRQESRAREPSWRQPNESSLEGYRAEVSQLLDSGRKPRAIWTLLQKRHPGLVTSEAAVWRLVQSISAGQPPQVVGRIETAPGEAAQVDFGYVGYLRDPQTGRKRKAWAFVLVLAWSRHTPHLRWVQVCTPSSSSTRRSPLGWSATNMPSRSSMPCRAGSSWTI